VNEDSFSWGIYVHTPWCRSRCPYCAFEVQTDSPQWEVWLRGVLDHFADEAPHFAGLADHLYFGGGTPSLAPPAIIGALIKALPIADSAEVTVEANPGTIDDALLQGLVDVGVNRLSVGIQTFQPRLARLLSRGHTVAQAADLLQLVRHYEGLGLDSWSADLIFAVPGETLEDLRADLEQLLETGAPHVSLYGLSFEPGTPLTRARDAGRIQSVDAELWGNQYDLVVDTLEAAGLQRYEVSNFSRPGHRGRHNGHIWRGGHYMGLGPSAHGFRPDGVRTRGSSGVDAWVRSPVGQIERPSREDAAADLILSTLRHIDGLPLGLLRSRTGLTVDRAPLRHHFDRGLLQSAPSDHIVLGTPGWPVADGLVRALVDALVQVDGAAGRQA